MRNLIVSDSHEYHGLVSSNLNVVNGIREEHASLSKTHKKKEGFALNDRTSRVTVHLFGWGSIQLK